MLGSLIKRYKGRYFPQARLHGLLSDALATGLKQQDGETNLAASVSKPPEEVLQMGSLHAMSVKLLDKDWEHVGSDISRPTSSEPLPFRASYPTKQTASFSDRTIKAAFLSQKQHKSTSVHLVQV